MPEFSIMADEDLLIYVEEEELRCQTARAAAEEARQEDQEQIRHTHTQLANLRFTHDRLQQHLIYPHLTPQRRTHIRNELRRLKGDINTLMDYLTLYTDLMVIRDQRLQGEYTNLLEAMEEVIERGLH